jgi:hypothetical protein
MLGYPPNRSNMNENPRPKSAYFWPALFLGAFAGGALLWAAWMYHIVVKTRQQTEEQRENSFFVPQGTPSATGAASNAAPAAPNPPARAPGQ